MNDDDGIAMIKTAASEALHSKRLLEVVYDGKERLVDVHTIGFNTRMKDMMFVWQSAGDNILHDASGWRLMYLDKVSAIKVTDKPSHAPRIDYKSEKCGVQCIVEEAKIKL